MEATSATVDDFAWLEGGWRGMKDADPVEEWWTAPGGDTLLGMFRWLKDDRVYLYELMGIEPSDAGLIFHVKHFSFGFDGWENRDESQRYLIEWIDGRTSTFLLQDPQKFVRLVYQGEDEDMLIVRLERSLDGTDALEFQYERVR
jgi:hypothetical protein